MFDTQKYGIFSAIAAIALLASLNAVAADDAPAATGAKKGTLKGDIGLVLGAQAGLGINPVQGQFGAQIGYRFESMLMSFDWNYIPGNTTTFGSSSITYNANKLMLEFEFGLYETKQMRFSSGIRAGVLNFNVSSGNFALGGSGSIFLPGIGAFFGFEHRIIEGLTAGITAGIDYYVPILFWPVGQIRVRYYF